MVAVDEMPGESQVDLIDAGNNVLRQLSDQVT
jgi:hypothetical protein